MSVRQYIGARYVPLFMGEWDITKNYEPLSIVQYQGNSYTSRQAVPAGIQITNETFWALTGNYNAQIEAYRQLVETFDERITENTENIAENAENIASISEQLLEQSGIVNETHEDVETMKKHLKVAMFDGSDVDNFTVRVAYNEDFAIMFDTGKPLDNDGIVSFCNSLGITHLDALVITHFHSDHCGNMSGIINSSLVDATTHVYKQMTCSNVNDQWEDVYQVHNRKLTDLLEEAGYPAAIVPNDNTSIDFGNDVIVTFWNTNPNNVIAYDTQSWANNGITDHRTTSLNNYSLITRVEVNNSSYVDTGDIEGMAQKFYSAYMTKCNVMLNPHHFANKMGYEEFFNNLNPDYILVANHFISGDTDISAVSVYNFRFSYLYRYLAYNSLDTLIVTNINRDCYFDIHNGVVLDFDGYIVDYTFDPGAQVGAIPPYSAILPPSIYKENPYWLLSDEFTIEQLISITREMPPHSILNEFYIYPRNSTSSWNNSPFVNAIRALWSPYNPTTQILISFPSQSGHIIATYSAINAPYCSIEIFSALDNFAECAFMPSNKQRIGQDVIESEFTNQDQISQTTFPQWGYMRANTCLEVTVTETNPDTGVVTSVMVGCYRKNGYMQEGGSMASIFDGFAFGVGHKILHHVLISLNGTVSISEIDIATGTVTHSEKVTKIRCAY